MTNGALIRWKSVLGYGVIACLLAFVALLVLKAVAVLLAAAIVAAFVGALAWWWVGHTVEVRDLAQEHAERMR